MRGYADTKDLCWAADAETDAEEVLSTELFDDVTHPIVSGGARRRSCLECPGSDIEIVVDDDDIVGGKFVEVDELAYSCPGCIHERSRFHEKDLFFSNLSGTQFSCHFLVALERLGTPFFLQIVEAQETGVMSRFVMIGAGIAQSDDEFHRSSMDRFLHFRCFG